MSLAFSSVREIRDRVNRGELRAEDVVRAAAERIDARDREVRAFLSLAIDAAMAEAREADRRVARGERLPLAGVPVAIKDVLCTRGTTTTCGSRILEGFRPAYDATAVARLRAAGAVVIGKTNLDEFAMGSSTENSAFGPVRNPWDPSRVPGGSSGGSAAAVAAGMVPAALGTDTGGSVRQPASLCGVVGLKPTYGRVSRFGLVAFASSLDQVGPLAGDVGDCAALLAAVAGRDPRDMTSAPEPVPDYEAALGCGVEGLRLGVPREYFGAGLAGDVSAAVLAALDRLREAGAEVREISLPHTDHAIPAYYLIADAEASSNLARYDGVRYGRRDPGAGGLEEMYRGTRSAGFGPEVKRRIMLGTFALSAGYYDAYYLRAQKVRRLVRRDFEEAFREVDLVACPTSPETAFRLGSRIEDPLAMYRSDVYTVTASLAGLPAISIPCGLGDDGLPVGLQLIGAAFDEPRLLAAARALERLLDLRLRPPRFAGAA
jgi:aspartyl-tRNA(Asn)/glutamyl-tRNA(Gln) amidotransferase subunit A